MKKIKILFIAVLVISVGLLSGCTENESDITEATTKDYIVSDTYASRGTDRIIEQVYVEIQNFGDNEEIFIVYFEFALLDLNQLGPGDYGGGRTNGGGSIWDDSYYIQKTEIVRAHDIKKICCTPRTQYDNKIPIEWDYHVE